MSSGTIPQTVGVALFNKRLCLLSAFAFASLPAQAAKVSLTFDAGFIAPYSNQPHNSLTSLTLLPDACIDRVAFIQDDSDGDGEFGGSQGNDLSGILRVFIDDGGTRSQQDIIVALNWRDTAGSVIDGFGFTIDPIEAVSWDCGVGTVDLTGDIDTVL